MATPLTPPGTHSPDTASDSTPAAEYRTLRGSYKAVIAFVKEQPGTMCDSLFAKGYISTTVRDFVRSKANLDEEKAQKLIDTVLDRVENDGSVYYGFLEILKNEGPSAQSIIATLEECFAVAACELAVQQSPVPMEVTAASTRGNEQEARQQEGLVEAASDTNLKWVLVTADKREDRKEKLNITDIHTLQDLTEHVRKIFGLDTHCTITLQIWDANFNDFVSIKDMNEIQNFCRINAAITKQARTPQIQNQVVYCNTGLFFGQPNPLGNTVSRRQGALGAYIPHNKLWKGRKVLKVFFKNSGVIRKWKCRNEPITTTNIFTWATIWNHPFHNNIIPQLEMTESIDDSDIRVQFLGEGSGCWSMVGTDAVGKDVTMALDLSRHNHILQRSLVIHEFGHALGLEHEHQRSDFWDIVGKHIDLEKMMKDPRVSASKSGDEQEGVGFETDWEATGASGDKEYSSEYDPKSIMHYCFDVKWLKGDLSTCAKIDEVPQLSDKEKKYLKAILQRSATGPLPKEPSTLDIQELVKAYESETTEPHQKPSLETAESFQNPTSNQYVTMDEEEDTQKSKIWVGRSVLKVYFMNPEVLKEWANGTRIDEIMAWASSWNSPLYQQIPRFEETNDDITADIRVMFSDVSGSWSAVGTDVQKVKKMKPTMILDLKRFGRPFQRYLVIHQFGHALGLEHEHQRMDFWDGIRKHIDTEKMENDKSTGNYSTSKAFKRDWMELGVKTHREIAIPYDPESIMHWWFAVNWLKDPKYHELENVNSDASLTDDEKRFLEGIHARNRKYVTGPSENDIKYLGDVYSQDHEDEDTDFESSEVEELLKQVDANKIKGTWLSTTDATDSDQVQHTWKKIAQFTAETNMELFREIVERCRKEGETLV